MLDVRFPHVLHEGIHHLMLHYIRDDPSRPTLTSFADSDPIGMTIEDCVTTCIGAKASIAGLQRGTDCRK